MSVATTKNKILDAAENLFASNGFAGTSLRAIIKKAGVNTASVHYHFGSKEGLIEAILHRRVGPFNQERLNLLDQLEARYPSGPLPLEEVIAAFLDPVIRAHVDRSRNIALFPRLMGRAITEPDKNVGDIFYKVFAEVIKRFYAAFERALPDLTQAEVKWRMHMMIGVMAFTVAVPAFHSDDEQRALKTHDPDMILNQLVEFIAAGMRVSTSTPDEKDHR
jgi:AcrR family transcriptional regulator